MELYSQDLHHRLLEKNRVFLIANRNGKTGLISFALRALSQGLFTTPRCHIVWSGDGAVSILGILLSKIFGKKSIVTVHGLDVTWKPKVYQLLIPKILNLHDIIVCVSENTRGECKRRGVNPSKMIVVPNTLSLNTLQKPEPFDSVAFLESIGIQKGKKKILFSIGRWIKRKGFHWFLEEVVPHLSPEKYHYILAGFGPYEDTYRKIISEKMLENVTILHKISDELKSKLFVCSDTFVMPNIKVEGDVEGFGIVLLEADFYRIDILCSDIDGIGCATKTLTSKCALLGSENASEWLCALKDL